MSAELTVSSHSGCSIPSSSTVSKVKKTPKRGIIYLSTIPPYMNVTQITEFFSDFGKVGRVYLQLNNTATMPDAKKSKKQRIVKKFTEGWVEFERKSVAKKVASRLNNTQISNRKKSKHYDILWNIKYLTGFKWPHLHERLAYEKAARRQKLRTEIQLAKKKTNFFTDNLDKGKKRKPFINKELQNSIASSSKATNGEKVEEEPEGRSEFLESLFSS